MTRWAAWVVLALTALVVHGLLLLNDGVYWDGWLVYSFVQERRFDLLFEWFTTSGLPLIAYLHWLFTVPDNTIAFYKISAFISVLGIAITAYHLAGRLLGGTDKERLVAALLVLTYPGYQTTVELVTLPYTLCLFLFLLAWSIALQAQDQRGRFRVLFRICALTLFFLSFTINSLLVLYLAAFITLLVQGRRLVPSGAEWGKPPLGTRRGSAATFNGISPSKERESNDGDQPAPSAGTITREYSNAAAGFLGRLAGPLISALPRNLDYLILPFVYWIAKEALFPRTGVYLSYNRFDLDLYGVMSRAWGFLVNGLAVPLYEAFRIFLVYPWLCVPVVMLAAWISARRHGGHSSGAAPATLALWGLGLLALSVAPYVLVGHVPSPSGWNTRHALLVGLPLAVLLTCMMRVFGTAGPIRRYAVALSLSACIVGFGGLQVQA